MRQINKIRGKLSLILIPTVVLCSILKVGEAAPPDALGFPILKSYLEGAPTPNGLKELVQSHSSKLLSGSDGSQGNPKDINQLISKLRPRKGKLDPVVMDMLSAFDRTYRDTAAVAADIGNSAETTYVFPDDTASARVASSTEENGVIWQDTTSRPRKRDRDSNRFSSRYRSNMTTSDYQDFNSTNSNSTESEVPSHIPFNHITDPNLRNHRLYDWEFETYKNFTHIDQAEDLMADEDHATETKLSVVAAPPPSNQHLSQLDKVEKNNKGDTESLPNLWPVKSNGSKSKRVRVKGIPHIVISLEDTSDNRYDPLESSYNYQLDSGERGIQRPREPLRHSSTENIVYVHGSAEYPYPTTMQEMNERYQPQSRPGVRSPQFRPSSVDIANEPLFVDPDQEFFTSTLRSTDIRNQGQPISEQDLSSETLPKRRRKKLKKINQEELEEIAQHAQAANRFSTRVGDGEDEDANQYSTLKRQQDRVNRAGIRYSPVYSKNTVQGTVSAQDRARAHQLHQTQATHLPHTQPTKFTPVGAESVKSDRIMYPTGGSSVNGGVDLSNAYAMYNQGQHQQQQQQQQQQQHALSSNYDSNPSAAHHHDGGIGNYYSLHNDPTLHAHSNLGASGAEQISGYGQNKHPLGSVSHNNQDLTSTEYLGGHINRLQNALSSLNIFGNQQQQHSQLPPAKKLQPASAADQVIAPGNIEDFYHPYAASDHQVNQYYEDSYYSSWSNTWYILAGLILFTAIFALILPALMSSQRHGKKDIRHDLDEEDFNTSNYQGGNNNHYHFDNTQNDVGQHSDVWTEMKGVYNDLVNLFRGDYSLLSKLKKVPEQGPKIVYREDEDMASSDEDEEDDEKTENRMPLRNKKKKRLLKKQKQMLKKQQNQLKQKQQNQPQPQHSTVQGQGKSHGHPDGRNEKTLVSRSKSEASREHSGKTINASSVNNLVVVSGPPADPITGREAGDDIHTSSPRGVTGFVLPDTSTLATIPFLNLTGYGGVSGLNPNSFLSEWAQVQLINNHRH